MSTLVHADIFFFITTIAVALVAILFLVALIYVIKLLKNITYISKKARDESDKIADDIDELRMSVKKSRFKTMGLISGIRKIFSSNNREKKQK